MYELLYSMWLPLLALLFVPSSSGSGLSSTKVTIESSGYKGVVIAIHPDIEESVDLIDAIKETWTNASIDLYVATENRTYFKQITILTPITWTTGNYNYAVGSENYDQADVIIAPANPAYGNEPYTLQYEGCGKPGIKTHYTPSYMLDETHVTNYGPRGKVVVHEWAHYRWGVFDEASSETPFYWDPVFGPSNGQAPTQCPRDITGDIRNVNSEYARCTLADFDTAKDSYPDYCVFFPHEKQYNNINTSMTSYQYLDYVVTFCKDEDETDSYNAHNIYAPNGQNAMCSMRSTWSVIKDSSDYLEWSINPVNDFSEIIPDFSIVRPQAPRFVLVLDDSGSMGSTDCGGAARYECVKTAVNLFLTETVPNGSYVGIVTFGSSAYVREYLTLVNSEQARNDLSNSVIGLHGGSGGTCIGCGIETGIDVLEHSGSTAAGGQLIVITDGQGSLYQNVVTEALTKGVIINTIFLVTQTNQELKNLTDDSGGKQFYARSQSDLLQTFSQLSASDSTGDNSYLIHSDNFNMFMGDTHNAFVLIDKTIGRSTVFTFTWSYGYSAPNISILSPKGCFYSNSPSMSGSLCFNATYDLAASFRTIKFKIPGLAKVGNWIYTVNATTYNYGTMTSVVTSAASNDSIEPIIVESGMSQTQVDDGSAAIVYAKVTQGYNPVLGAIVTAKVSGSTGSPKVIDLYDNGAGCDIAKNDGVYSRYFTEFTGSGRYSVEINVGNGPKTQESTKKVGSRANYRPGTILPDGTVNVNPNGAVSTEGSQSEGAGIQSEDIGEFSRVVPSESFDYTGTVDVDASGAVTIDNFPPAKIIDATIRQNDLADYTKGIVIQFTATGNDFDQGKADGYDIRYTFDDPTSLLKDFGGSHKIEEVDVLQGNLSDPSPSGQLEELIIQTPDLPLDVNGEIVNNSRLAFAIKAFDSSGNYAEPSNIPITNFFIEPLVIPTAAPTVKPTTTKKTTTSLSTTTTSTTTTCKQCEVCDPNTELYKWLSTGFAISTGMLLTSTLIISIWLCKSNKRRNRVGTLDSVEMNQPVQKTSKTKKKTETTEVIVLDQDFDF